MKKKTNKSHTCNVQEIRETGLEEIRQVLVELRQVDPVRPSVIRNTEAFNFYYFSMTTLMLTWVWLALAGLAKLEVRRVIFLCSSSRHVAESGVH